MTNKKSVLTLIAAGLIGGSVAQKAFANEGEGQPAAEAGAAGGEHKCAGKKEHKCKAGKGKKGKHHGKDHACKSGNGCKGEKGAKEAAPEAGSEAPKAE